MKRRDHSEIMVGERSGVNIPLDLKVEIFEKLPAKCVVRFLCVSKLWKTIIKHFIIKDSIVTRSLTQPPRDHHFLLERMHLSRSSSDTSPTYSIAYCLHQTTHKEELLSLDETLRDGLCIVEFQYVRGLIGYDSSPHCCCPRFTIHNLTTKQYVSLAYNSTQSYDERCSFFFGYDPLSNQYKVVCLARSLSKEMMSCGVYTLGNSKKQWRNIPCRIEFHYPFGCSVCINGVIYYKAFMNSSWVLVSVDVRSERFNHVQTPEELLSICLRDATLVDYQGKLGCICKDNLNMDLWVLESVSEWSKINTYVDVLRDLPSFFIVAGITHPDGEMVIVSQSEFTNLTPITVYYYDMKLKKRRRDEIKTARSSRELISIMKVITDHVENIMCLS